MNQINFAGDGLTLDNTTWYNAKTGDSFKVRSNYFENNRMILQTYDGRTFDLEHMNDYVQWQGSGAPPSKPIEQVHESHSDLPPEVAGLISQSQTMDGMDPEDAAMISGISTSVKPSLTQFTKNTNYDIIDRALAKTKTPDWNIVMKWDKFPQREIEMLVDVMDVPMDEIADYYMNKITSEFDSFLDNIKDQLQSYLTEKANHATEPSKTESKTNGKTTKKPATHTGK